MSSPNLDEQIAAAEAAMLAARGHVERRVTAERFYALNGQKLNQAMTARDAAASVGPATDV